MCLFHYRHESENIVASVIGSFERTERRSTSFAYLAEETPGWVRLPRRDFVISKDIQLTLVRHEMYEDVEYRQNTAGVLKCKSVFGSNKTDERLVVTIPAGSRVAYLPVGSRAVCFIGNVMADGRQVQISFEPRSSGQGKAKKALHVVRVKEYRRHSSGA